MSSSTWRRIACGNAGAGAISPGCSTLPRTWFVLVSSEEGKEHNSRVRSSIGIGTWSLNFGIRGWIHHTFARSPAVISGSSIAENTRRFSVNSQKNIALFPINLVFYNDSLSKWYSPVKFIFLLNRETSLVFGFEFILVFSDVEQVKGNTRVVSVVLEFPVLVC